MKLKTILFTTLVALTITSCGGGGGDDASTEGLVLSTPQVSEITSSSARFTSTATGSAQTLKRGFCYGQKSDITISTATTVESGLDVTVSGLTSSTSYYVKAYAVTGNGTVYSSAAQFTTAAQSGSGDLSSYVCPTYKDNYTSIASWTDRSKWNLSNVHDPSVVLADDGYYYMYQTDASYGNAHSGHGHFFCRRSKDLVNWEFMGATMNKVPSWVQTKLNEIRTAMGLGASTANFSSDDNFGFWAPCVRKVKTGLYRMYYCIVVPGYINGSSSWSERAFIGMMENSDPSNLSGWVDKGYVITNCSDHGLNYNVKPTDWANCYFKYNAIDPSYIITPSGEHWLIYGSWHSGIAAVQLNADTGKPLKALGNPWGDDISAYGKLIYTRLKANRWQASEGPEVVYHDGYYYLFLAYDELSVAYNTRVVRSRNIDGPYTDIMGTDGTNVGGESYPVVTHPYKFSGDQGWVGISHCAVFDDGKGNWFYASQGRMPEGVSGINASNAIMMGQVRSILWTSSGWPVVMPERYGAVPKVAITASEIAGTWEHIDLSYSYAKQKTSSEMIFAADGTITSGAWKGGKWSFNASTNTLTANGVELRVQREVDWESSPRKLTIVYAGINGQKTYWGKKK